MDLNTRIPKDKNTNMTEDQEECKEQELEAKKVKLGSSQDPNFHHTELGEVKPQVMIRKATANTDMDVDQHETVVETSHENSALKVDKCREEYFKEDFITSHELNVVHAMFDVKS